MTERLANIHPGQVLLHEFMEPLGLSPDPLAQELGIQADRIVEVVLGERPVNPETAVRLACYFGTSQRFWLGLQADYDLEQARLSR